MKFIVPRDAGRTISASADLRITWDDRWHASVDAPIDLFFGAGQLHNDDGREYLVRGLPLVVRYTDDEVHLACYWPMPFFTNARIEIQNRGDTPLNGVRYEIRTVPYRDPPNHVGYFHATYSDHPVADCRARTCMFLDTDQREGGGAWSGNFVGMSWIFIDTRQPARRSKAIPRFFFDDSRTPQAMGHRHRRMGRRRRLLGRPQHDDPARRPSRRQRGGQDKSGTRPGQLGVPLPDRRPFPIRQSRRHRPGARRRQHVAPSTIRASPTGTAARRRRSSLTDQLNVCHEADAKRHDYKSPTAEPPYTLVSRYEWGPDRDDARLVAREGVAGRRRRQFYPAEEDYVAHHARHERVHHAARSRRTSASCCDGKFDYQYPNQRAKVSVRPAAGSRSPWQYVGEWYTAGSNTCVHSRPGGDNFSPAELAPTEHNVITSNRRWREEEFLIPRRLTRGRRHALRIRIEHVPDDRPLFPGHPFPVENAWSESRYWAFCYRLPEPPHVPERSQ